MKVQGEIKNRDRFLQHLTEKLGRSERERHVTRPNWEQNPQYQILEKASIDELVTVFKQAAHKVNTTVFETTIQKLPNTIHEVIQQLDGKSTVIWGDPRFEQYNLFSTLNEPSLHIWNPNQGENNIKAAQSADIGITFSDYTLAESATVVLSTSSEKGRSVSLLPKSFIALIPKSTLVPRLTQVTDRIHERFQETNDISSCIKFISGPSNSADIELSFIEGVHGPVKAVYILIEDC